MKPLGTADRLQSKYLKFPACELWSADSVPSQPRPLDQQIRRRPSLYPVDQQSGGTLALSSISTIWEPLLYPLYQQGGDLVGHPWLS